MRRETLLYPIDVYSTSLIRIIPLLQLWECVLDLAGGTSPVLCMRLSVLVALCPAI